jgi:16S rRNA (adenine1518-N6/adenine1519-N6)-dimethyltransferase
MKPKKQLGQHWLHDEYSLESMAEMAPITEDDFVLEVGPGLGTLTEVLLNRGSKVLAVEYDRELYEALCRSSFAKDDNLEIIHNDILKVDLTQLPENYKVVANIPYYLTSNLVRVLSESTNPPASATLLIQKEVAERIATGPGDMSLLTVSTQMYFEAELGPVVPAILFTPPPKIDSQIIHLKRRPQPLYGDLNSKLLFRVVKAGFSNRRKTLLNSLSAGLHLSKDQTRELLAKVEISPTKRPQELSLDNWIELATVFEREHIS